MKEFTMFQLCKEPDGYFVYYNYANKKLYGCYNTESDVKPNYSILLVQPFIVFAVKFLDSWIIQWGEWYSRFACILAIFLTTVSSNIFYKKMARSQNEVLSRRLQELPEVTREEWKYYLQLAKQQLRKHLYVGIWLGSGLVVSAVAFVWYRGVMLLLIYMALYLVLHLFVSEGNPICKYKLIKAGK